MQTEKQIINEFREQIRIHGIASGLDIDDVTLVLSGNDKTVWNVLMRFLEKKKEEQTWARFRKLYLEEPFTGTIEERLTDGYLYRITDEDLSLIPKEREKRQKLEPTARKYIMISTGKIGVLAYVESRKKHGRTEEQISRSIWMEMGVDNIILFINIKNLRIKDDKKEDTVKKDSPEAN